MIQRVTFILHTTRVGCIDKETLKERWLYVVTVSEKTFSMGQGARRKMF